MANSRGSAVVDALKAATGLHAAAVSGAVTAADAHYAAAPAPKVQGAAAATTVAARPFPPSVFDPNRPATP